MLHTIVLIVKACMKSKELGMLQAERHAAHACSRARLMVMMQFTQARLLERADSLPQGEAVKQGLGLIEQVIEAGGPEALCLHTQGAAILPVCLIGCSTFVLLDRLHSIPPS